jgi:FtsH-binding integral membrane protein
MNQPFSTTQDLSGFVSDADRARVAAFLRGVFWWMSGGWVITAAVAAFVAGSPAAIDALLGSKLLLYGLIIAELGLVFYLSARVATLSPTTAGALFITYAALNGVTFSLILLAYTGASVATTFLVSAGMFGSLAVYGHITKRDLTAMGRFMFMGLIGLILASIVGFFWHSDALQFAMGVVGVLVFAGLTAYDTQRLQTMALQLQDAQAGSYAIAGALSLYLDFVNMFLSLLRLFGRKR